MSWSGSFPDTVPDDRHSISFDRLAAVYDATRGGLERGEGFARDLAPFVRGSRIVDVGIGTGAVALPLQELIGRPVLGVDISPAMLERAVERVGRRVAVADAERLPLCALSVDTVLLVWVLQLVPDIGRVLAETRRLLRPAGRLLVVVSRPHERPDDIDYLQRQMFERLGRFAPDGVHHVADLAHDHGFRVLERGQTTEQEWDQTPIDAAERLEQRTFAALLDLDDARFEEIVLPIAREMRGLPEPERARRRGSRHDYLVLERPA
jgi:ubiquinone/menaquinone biosynthesis C-methylase UbiE